jgi:hypothetical protein
VHLETQLTEADFIAAAKMMQRRRPGAWFKIYVVPFICLILTLPLVAMSWLYHPDALQFAPLILALCFPAWFFFFGNRRRLARHYRDKISLQSRNFVDIDDTGIRSRYVASEHFYVWSDFAAYAESKTIFVGFLDSRRMFYMLNKRDMAPTEIAEVRAYFQTHLTPRRIGPTRRGFIRGALVAAVVVPILWFEVPALFWYYGIDLTSKQHPKIASSIPTPVPDSSIGHLDGRPFSAFGCTVQPPFRPTAEMQTVGAPLNEVDVDDDDGKPSHKERRSEGYLAGSFGLIALNPKVENDPLRNLRRAKGVFIQNVRDSLGLAIVNSQYEFYHSILYSRPSDRRLLDFTGQNHRVFQLLSLKDAELTTQTYRPVYELHAGNIRGFQFGDVNAKFAFIRLELFDPHGRRASFDVFDATRLDRSFSQPLTQPQINAMVASLRCQ